MNGSRISEQGTGENEFGDGEINDEAGDVDEDGDERRR